MKDAMKAVMSGGWAGLDELQKRFEEIEQEDRDRQLEMAQMVAAAFQTPAGRETLAWLRSMTLERASWAGGHMLPLDVVTSYGLFREGQNSIVAKIEQAIALADEQPVKSRGDGDA